MAMPQFTPQQKAFMVSEFLRSNNINLVRQSFTNEYPDVRCPSRIRTRRASYTGYSFVKLWRTKFMLLLRRNSDTIKAFCCGVNCGIAISKCTGYYTRKCVSAQTTRKHKFHGNSTELSWE